MKLYKSTFGDFEPLCRFASTDETRYHLKGIYFDESGWCISTDGHRLFGTKQLFSEKHAGQIAKLEPFAGSWDICPFDKETRYPHWKQFTPTKKMNHALDTVLPQWLEAFKKPTKAKIPLYFSYEFGNGEVTLTKPRSDEPNYFCLNAALIAPLAGRDVCIQWQDELSPVLITPKFGPWNDNEWFAVIMPMRGGDGMVAKAPKVYMEDLEKFNDKNVKPMRRDA